MFLLYTRLSLEKDYQVNAQSKHTLCISSSCIISIFLSYIIPILNCNIPADFRTDDKSYACNRNSLLSPFRFPSPLLL